MWQGTHQQTPCSGAACSCYGLSPLSAAERDLPHPAILSAHALIRLEGATLDPLWRYEEGVRKLIEVARRHGRDPDRCAKTPQLYESCHDPVCLYASTRTSTWSSMPHGCGDTPEQDRCLVGHGLDASRELFLAALMTPRNALSPRVMPWPQRRVSPTSSAAMCMP